MSALTEKMKTMVGYCTNCGVEVMDITRARGKKKLDNYREHTMEMSDGSLLSVAVCEECKTLLVTGDKVQETAERILKHHKIYWQENSKDDHGDARPSRFDKITISDPSSNILKVRSKKVSELERIDSEKVEQEERNMKERSDYLEEETKRLEDIRAYNESHTKQPQEKGEK